MKISICYIVPCGGLNNVRWGSLLREIIWQDLQGILISEIAIMKIVNEDRHFSMSLKQNYSLTRPAMGVLFLATCSTGKS